MEDYLDLQFSAFNGDPKRMPYGIRWICSDGLSDVGVEVLEFHQEPTLLFTQNKF